MKTIIILICTLFSINSYGQNLGTVWEGCGQRTFIYYSDSIHQQVIFSPLINKYTLITSDGSLYDNVIHGSLEFIEQQRLIEYNKALLRRKPIAIITVKCKN